MYYHVTYKLEKQIGSLEGKFSCECPEKHVFIFLYNQIPSELHFVVIASINPGILKTPVSMIQSWLQPSLYFLIREEARLDQLTVSEIDRDQLNAVLKKSVRYLRDFDDLLKLGNAFLLKLPEYSGEYHKDTVVLSVEDMTVKQKIDKLNLKKNLFMINPTEKMDEDFIVMSLIQRLIDAHQAISKAYFQLEPQDFQGSDKIVDLTDPTFIHTVLGKSLIIRVDYSKESSKSLFSPGIPLIFPINQLSKVVPVIVILKNRISDRLAENFAQECDAVIISEN